MENMCAAVANIEASFGTRYMIDTQHGLLFDRFKNNLEPQTTQPSWRCPAKLCCNWDNSEGRFCKQLCPTSLLLDVRVEVMTRWG